MKKSKIACLSFLLCAASAQAQTTNPAPYCAAGYDDGSGIVPHYIKNVTLGTLNNTSGNTQFAAPHYAYYNTVAAPSLTKGNSYNLSIGHDGGQTIHWVVAFIDFNHNNSFNDAGERVLQQKLGTITNPAIASVTVPATAAAGTTRMRIMVFEDDPFTIGGNPTNAPACTADNTGSFDWGETEDYNVNITGTTTAVEELALQAKANFIYPNPAKDRLYLKDATANAAVIIADIQGRIVLEQRTIRSNGIDIRALKAGTYFIKVIKDNGVFTQTLVIEK